MKKLGRYDLIRVLGKGAMGMVYEARDPNLDRKVAIKTIKVENLSEEEANEYELRFRTEARSAARLQHPNIVSVYDSDRDVDVAYLVIEFINGEDLKHHLDRGDVYTLGQTLSIMGDLLSALDYAHRNGIVHRDIKPANLLLEPGGRVKLADFGVARIQDCGEATRTQGSMVGTLKYMSPEQVQSHPVDARADLFAAGIVLYQLLTGVRPFDGGSDFEVIQKITTQNPAPPSSMTLGLPKAIDAVVARALEKSRENRYPTAMAFKDALFAAVEDVDTDQTVAPRAKVAVARAPAGAESTVADSASGVTSTVTQELELVYWKDITESNDAADFEGFLERFPSGIYADLAKRKLKRLRAADDSESGAGLASGAQSIVPTVALGPVPSVADAAGAASVDAPLSSLAQDAVASQAGRRHAGLLVVLAVVLGGGAGYWWWSGTAARETQAAVVSSAQPPVAAAVTVPSAPPIGVAVSVATASTLSSTSAVAASKPLASISATKPGAGTAAAVGPKQVASAPPTPEQGQGASSVSPVAGGAKTPGITSAGSDPRVACKDHFLLGYQLCLSRKCGEAAFAQHPVCVERHEMERNNKNRNQSTSF